LVCRVCLKTTGDGDLLLRGEKCLIEIGSSSVMTSVEGYVMVGLNGAERWFKSWLASVFRRRSTFSLSDESIFLMASEWIFHSPRRV